ncbi:MAG: hypothetical protein LBN36_01590 [Clostridiales Family XIII bacterium]|jgi:hypothetical protein|nr:hypothetical protein [Clostridiales Family XIII bacterium]
MNNNATKKKRVIVCDDSPVVMGTATLDVNLERIQLAGLTGEERERNLQLAEKIEESRLIREAKISAENRGQQIFA